MLQGFWVKMASNLVLISLKDSFSVMLKNKKLIMLIFFLQIIFFLLIGFALSYFAPAIIQNAEKILVYMENLSTDPQTAAVNVFQKKSPLGDDPLLVSRAYREIIKNFQTLLFAVLAIFVLINGPNWYLSCLVADSKSQFSMKGLLSYLWKFLIIAIVLLFFAYITALSFIRIFFSSFLHTAPLNSLPLLIFGAISIYFIYIAVPLINKIKINDLPKTSLMLGIKRFFPVFSAAMIIIMAILASLSFLYMAEKHLFLLLPSLIFIILLFVWSKIFLTLVINKLAITNNQKI
jgi:hypothetical protein